MAEIKDLFDGISQKATEAKQASETGAKLQAVLADPVGAIRQPKATLDVAAEAMTRADNSFLQDGVKKEAAGFIGSMQSSAKSIAGNIPGAEGVIDTITSAAFQAATSIMDLLKDPAIAGQVKEAGAKLQEYSTGTVDKPSAPLATAVVSLSASQRGPN